MWLWILCAIVLLIVFLLSVGVKIHISYNGDVTLALSVLGIRIPILPKRKKKINLRNFTRKKHAKRLRKDAEAAKKKRQKEIEKTKKKQAKKLAKKKDKNKKLPKEEIQVDDEPSMLSLLLSVVGGVLDKFFGMLHVDAVRVRITVGGPDAAKTALTYGIVSQGVAYLMELIAQKTKFRRVKNEYISVVPDFLSEKTMADISFVFTLRLWYFIHTACILLCRLIKEKIRRASVRA